MRSPLKPGVKFVSPEKLKLGFIQLETKGKPPFGYVGRFCHPV